MLKHLGKFTETLLKIHTFVEAQQEKSKIKQFFRQGEMRALLKDCFKGLGQALEAFKIQGVILLSDMAQMQKHAQEMHEEVLEMMSALSNGETSDTGSTISRVLSSSLDNATPRIAILGAGGIGKTSLAKAILHHPDISARYNQCQVFVPCDTASSIIQLASLIGGHLGLKPGDNLTQPVIRHFASSPPSLLILDNLETLWEPRESCQEVEKFLALLADVDHLALIITMRGAERPANVRWTRPFLEPLKPLAQDAARQTFLDIADNGHTLEEIDKILLLVDNMPLAIDLIAHLVDYEGLANGLSDTELIQSKLPINNVLACKARLLCTSLAYTDDQKRLKALVPIREYIQRTQPPMTHIIQPLRQYFQELLEVYETFHGTVSNPGTAQHIVDQTLESFTYFDDADLKCHFYNSLSRYFHGHNEIPRAISFAQTGQSLAISTGNIGRQSDLLGTLAWIECTTGHYSAGQEHAYESQRLANICGNPYKAAWALRIESVSWYALGSYRHSNLLGKRARNLLQLCGMSGSTLDYSIMGIQAEVHFLKSEYSEARNIRSQILHNCSMEQNPYQHAMSLLNIAQIDIEIGLLGHEFQINLDRANRVFGIVGFSMGVICCDIVKAAMDVKEGDFLKACCQFQKSLTLSWGKDSEVVMYCLEKLGDICLWPATDHVSCNAPVTFLVYSLKLAQKREIHKALQFLGDVYLTYGDQQTAMNLWVVALEGFTQMDVHRSRAECMLRLGDLSKLQGDIVKAAELWKTARPLFERSSQGKQMAHIDERLSGISCELLDRPSEPLIHLSDPHAPSASPDELDVGQINITPSNAPAVDIMADDDGSDPILVPA
ncbi:hypothetical protein FB451DRAFT_1372419 [Mycena latifolia]|nr:hypothetical protein FB451DRAFT_1372419 [Mycena latifolia]